MEDVSHIPTDQMSFFMSSLSVFFPRVSVRDFQVAVRCLC